MNENTNECLSAAVLIYDLDDSTQWGSIRIKGTDTFDLSVGAVLPFLRESEGLLYAFQGSSLILCKRFAPGHIRLFRKGEMHDLIDYRHFRPFEWDKPVKAPDGCVYYVTKETGEIRKHSRLRMDLMYNEQGINGPVWCLLFEFDILKFRLTSPDKDTLLRIEGSLKKLDPHDPRPALRDLVYASWEMEWEEGMSSLILETSLCA